MGVSQVDKVFSPVLFFFWEGDGRGTLSDMKKKLLDDI